MTEPKNAKSSRNGLVHSKTGASEEASHFKAETVPRVSSALCKAEDLVSS